MKNLSICIVDTDPEYLKAFAHTLAVDHAGFTLDIRNACDASCARDCDVCLRFDAALQGTLCARAYEPVCGKYAGVSEILSEAFVFAVDHAAFGKGICTHPSAGMRDAAALKDRSLVCVFSWTGGVGTSCAAIGMARELARYRGECVCYVSLEDAEESALFPPGLCAMCAEETYYRYLKLSLSEAPPEAYEQLFCAAVCRDAYGLYRFAPDVGRGGFATLTAEELSAFVRRLIPALGLRRVVLDFGTRLHFFSEFASRSCADELFCTEVFSEVAGMQKASAEKRRPLLGTELDEAVLPASFPLCDDDIRCQDGFVEIGLANAFGFAVKTVCDRIAGEELCL